MGLGRKRRGGAKGTAWVHGVDVGVGEAVQRRGELARQRRDAASRRWIVLVNSAGEREGAAAAFDLCASRRGQGWWVARFEIETAEELFDCENCRIGLGF